MYGGSESATKILDALEICFATNSNAGLKYNLDFHNFGLN